MFASLKCSENLNVRYGRVVFCCHKCLVTKYKSYVQNKWYIFIKARFFDVEYLKRTKKKKKKTEKEKSMINRPG